MKNNKGFTLVELIIVIAILAIIMLIAIPNFSGIQQRMQVRADKATAAQIGKAVRVWFTDCSTDPSLVAVSTGTNGDTTGSDTTSGNYAPANIMVRTDANKAALVPTRYENLMGIEGYISCGQKPVSMKNTTTKQQVGQQIYGVFLTANNTNAAAKIVVTISSLDTTDDYDKVDATNLTAGYDGNGTGIAYIEP